MDVPYSSTPFLSKNTQKENLGLLQANAYDENGGLLKEFRIGSLEKDDSGNYQLKDMEITDRERPRATAPATQAGRPG